MPYAAILSIFVDKMLQLCNQQDLPTFMWQIINFKGQTSGWQLRADRLQDPYSLGNSGEGCGALKKGRPLCDPVKHGPRVCRIVRILLRSKVECCEGRKTQFEGWFSIFMPLLYFFSWCCYFFCHSLACL